METASTTRRFRSRASYGLTTGAGILAVASAARGLLTWPPGLRTVLSLLGGVPLALVIFRLARSRVDADADGVTVVNPFSVVRLPWRDIERFELRSALFNHEGRVVLRNGTTVPIRGIGPARSGHIRAPAPAVAMIDELNLLLAQRAPKRA